MKTVIMIGPNGISFEDDTSIRRERHEKGKSLIAFPTDFVVLDLETTGLDPQFDEIIEFAALRVRNGEIIDSFSTFIKPEYEVDDFITKLTGITNEMLSDAPPPKKILPTIREFIGDDIVVGHNVNFDINFLYDGFENIFGKPFTNDFVDTMRLSRKALPDLQHHRLIDIAKALDVIPDGTHRALKDCNTVFSCFCKIREHVCALGSVEDFINSFKRHTKKLDLREVTAENTDFDETHPLFGKRCVFTGKLEKMTRAEAAQIVVNIGGVCENGITKNTNYLILGNNDYCKTIKDGKSSKQKKAEEYKLSGIDIEVIPENVFYDMLE